jgi:hypothetical protein
MQFGDLEDIVVMVHPEREEAREWSVRAQTFG